MDLDQETFKPMRSYSHQDSVPVRADGKVMLTLVVIGHRSQSGHMKKSPRTQNT